MEQQAIAAADPAWGSVGPRPEHWTQADCRRGEFWDDITGEPLDPEQVAKARAEEMVEFRKHGVYVKAPVSQCVHETGKPPIAVRWVDVNKGDQEHPEYRSRLVAKELRTHKDLDLFAATPPLEALKVLLSLAATIRPSGNSPAQAQRLDFIDVRRAFFHAMARRRVYVALPTEDHTPGQCGLLVKAMYGTRDAAMNWEGAYTDFMTKVGFKSAYTVCVLSPGSRPTGGGTW